LSVVSSYYLCCFCFVLYDLFHILLLPSQT
jgi:hypothetical protein